MYRICGYHGCVCGGGGGGVLERSSKMAHSFPSSMFWKLGSLSIIYMLLIGLHTLMHANVSITFVARVCKGAVCV